MNVLKAIIISILISACGGSKNITKDKDANEAGSSITPMYEFYRGACFGTCPVFRISIYTDKTAIYEGIRFFSPSRNLCDDFE